MSSSIICLQCKSVLLDKPNTQSPDLPADQARRSRKGDTIASDLEQATGIEREEIEAFMAGEEASPLKCTLQIHVPQLCLIWWLQRISVNRDIPIRIYETLKLENNYY